MSSVFDSTLFNERLFPARRDATSPPEAAEDALLEVAEGITLHARAHWSKEPIACFVVFHGNAEVVADYDALAHWYRSKVNADLIVIDYRGYGLSSGLPTFRDIIADAAPAVQAVRLRWGERLRGGFIVMGRSVGGACAAELASVDAADAVVLESAPADLLAILQRRNLELASPLTESELAVFDPGPKLARSSLPILVIHGADDYVIRPHEARANFARVRHKVSRLELIPGRGHGDVLHDPRYYEILREFAEAVAESLYLPPSSLRFRASESPLLSADGLERRLSRAVTGAPTQPSSKWVGTLAANALRVLLGIRRAWSRKNT